MTICVEKNALIASLLLKVSTIWRTILFAILFWLSGSLYGCIYHQRMQRERTAPFWTLKFYSTFYLISVF